MRKKVVVVGGGPAGSTLALSLVREHGVNPGDIVVLERTRHPRDKPCGGAISNFGVRALEELGVAMTVPCASIGGLRVLRGERAAAVKRTLGVVVRRDEFDADLFSRVRETGVKALEEEQLVALDRNPGGFVLRTRTKVIEARYIAACDGTGSTTRKLLGLREPARKGHLYVTETPERESDLGPTTNQCDFDLTPSVVDGIDGYYWDFPALMGGSRCVSRGIYHANLTPSKDVKASLQRQLAKRGITNASLRAFSTRPFVRDTQLSGDGWLLVGEAAGIDRTTGEGIAQAIAYARSAASHLAKALSSGTCAFPGYEREIRTGVVGRHLLQSAWLASRVYGPRGRPYQDYLLSSRVAIESAVRWYEMKPLRRTRLFWLAVGLAREVLGANFRP